MKKLLFGALILGLVTACNRDNMPNQNEDTTNLENSSPSVVSKRNCPSEEMRKDAWQKDPSLMQKAAELETAAQKFANDVKFGKVLADGTVEIPVVVNVLYRTASENVSDARIAEQIDVLNSDFGGTNSDVSKIPTEFQPVKAGDVKVRFKLVNTVRKSTTKRSWDTNTYLSNKDMKRASTGGIDATNSKNYFNIWVVSGMKNLSGTILGYATFPESNGTWEDGVVIGLPFFGKTGTAAAFNLGRTTTHEVGHYLGLRHIWGDTNCGDDLIADTPTQTTYNTGVPTYPLYNTCYGVKRSVMFMNYMDYSDDITLYMFTAGQKTKMQSTVAPTGPRAGLRVL
ncbi:zinc metalloprotease [Chryseobacterium sp. PMSZPI]|uniref:zinc metalloprotease n=1 Tax=Chryseobacterium sp. PMSZPI TaxID=1033900 RepID=UPI000C3275CC|nr:zinc metalloprotease [Chryseobacterium sp. PMSZPI]PKF72405.1 zinc metalloprotease [Chryseobacterium sp. PMSZPI]